jgi:predicted transcriptional regulator of viral defense system
MKPGHRLLTIMSVGSKATEVMMMARTAVGVPPALARRRNRVLRPRDAASVYVNPRTELARLAHNGVAHRVTTGYYALTPQSRLGDPDWRPELNAAALALAQTDYGTDGAALMGVGAARFHGAIPRSLAVTVVAVPKQRPTLTTTSGRIHFVRRDLERLDLERATTELTTGWVTTVEQTILDLAAHPALGGLPEQDRVEALRALWARADPGICEDLALAQRRQATLRRAGRLITGGDTGA